MATKPKEYLKDVQGFGTWRIAYDPTSKKWVLACNLRAKGQRWEPVKQFDVVEAAAVVVGERRTGLGMWDGLLFATGTNFDLSTWKTEASEGVQGDAAD